jgi:dTDP-4-dehydrorhamnose reductase
MRKIYIAGCGGMLGEAFYETFRGDYVLKCTDKDVNEEWLTYLDFCNYAAYRDHVQAFAPDYLFHVGAETDLEYCEQNIDAAYETNTIAVQFASRIANDIGIPLLFISTAGVFDGKQESYDDWAQPNPVGHYGKSKHAAEVFVQHNVQRHLVCRAGWMMGAGPRKDKKFIHKLMTQIKQGAKQLFVVNDKYGTPTYTHDFARNVKVIIEREMWGLYNVVCSGSASRVEVAAELLCILRLEQAIELIEVSSDHFKDEYFAPRPCCECLLSRKLDGLQLNIMRDWRVALREYISRYYASYL